GRSSACARRPRRRGCGRSRDRWWSSADGHLEWTTTPQELPAGVTLTRLDPAAAVAASVQAPGDRAAAIAVARSGGATALSVARNTVVDEPVEITLTGRGDVL
ncbi:MAG: hypothetical protein J0I50_04715, partial [Microbacterium sp.]|nr:hypothetical protein [Microbacterium sp.]